jgi:hypothetical protein
MKETILILNSKEKSCGVYQWGSRLNSSLSKSTNYNVVYREVDSEDGARMAIQGTNPYSLILYNYHPFTMPWVTPSFLNGFGSRKSIAIVHDDGSCIVRIGKSNTEVAFDNYILLESSKHINHPVWKNRVFTIGRVLCNYTGSYPTNLVPTIGAHGFGGSHKRFELIAHHVNKEFDEAIINFHIPYGKYADGSGAFARQSVKLCKAEITKPGIILNFSHDLLSEKECLIFLAGNDINADLRANVLGLGTSSCLDLLLSVERPFIISNSSMFKHVLDKVSRPIDIEATTIKNVLEYGNRAIRPLRELWSTENTIREFEGIFYEVIHQ